MTETVNYGIFHMEEPIDASVPVPTPYVSRAPTRSPSSSAAAVHSTALASTGDIDTISGIHGTISLTYDSSVVKQSILNITCAFVQGPTGVISIIIQVTP